MEELSPTTTTSIEDEMDSFMAELNAPAVSRTVLIDLKPPADGSQKDEVRTHQHHPSLDAVNLLSDHMSGDSGLSDDVVALELKVQELKAAKDELFELNNKVCLFINV